MASQPLSPELPARGAAAGADLDLLLPLRSAGALENPYPI